MSKNSLMAYSNIFREFKMNNNLDILSPQIFSEALLLNTSHVRRAIRHQPFLMIYFIELMIIYSKTFWLKFIFAFSFQISFNILTNEISYFKLVLYFPTNTLFIFQFLHFIIFIFNYSIIFNLLAYF